MKKKDVLKELELNITFVERMALVGCQKSGDAALCDGVRLTCTRLRKLVAGAKVIREAQVKIDKLVGV